MTFTPSNLPYYKMQHNNTVCINNVIHAESFEKPSKHLLELNPSFNQKKKSIKKKKEKKPRGDFKANTKQGAGIIILPQYLEKPFNTGTMPTTEA